MPLSNKHTLSSKRAPAPQWLIERPIAHRGLHDLTQGRAENSMAAFKAAIDSGYAIECDLQMSQDHKPVVFHDPSLTRMTGNPANVRDIKLEALQCLKLLDTQDVICPLEEHLNLVNGQVPLILELKGVKGEDNGFVEGVATALERYKGPVCVMSFDPWICAQFSSLMPHLPRGLTAEGKSAEQCATHYNAMQEYDLNFVSYNVDDLPSPFIQDMKQQGLPIITWTVRNQESAKKTYQYADQITFEGFTPIMPAPITPTPIPPAPITQA